MPRSASSSTRPPAASGSSTPARAGASATAASAGGTAPSSASAGAPIYRRSRRPTTAPGKTPAPSPGAPPRWLGEALTVCAQFLFEQGAVEMIALHGAAILYTNVPLDLDRGRWLLVRFPAAAHEVAPQLLAVVAPLEKGDPDGMG